MLFFCCIWTLLTYTKQRIKFSNQQVYSYFYIVGWGKTGPAQFSPLQNVPIFLFIFSSFGLCNSLNVSEHFWMTYSKVRIKFSNLQVYWYFYIVGWGKTGPAQFFPPSKMFLSFYLSFRLLEFATLWMYLNTFEWPIPKWELSFLTYKFIGTSTLWGGERLGRPILSPLQNVWIFQFIV